MAPTSPRKTDSVKTEDSVEIKIKQSYVAKHLQSVDVFESESLKIQNDGNGKNWNELSLDTKIRYRTFSTSAIISCIAFLEATVNTIVWRIIADESELHGNGYHIHPTLRSQVNANKILEIHEKHKPFFEKYEAILEERGEQKIDRGGGIGQNAGYVNDLRNHLVHGTPELIEPDELPDGTEGLPRDVRWSNPFDSDDISMASLDRCLGSQMIEWAADSCFAYAEEFFDRLDIENDISPDATPLPELHTDENPARPYAVVLGDLNHEYR